MECFSMSREKSGKDAYKPVIGQEWILSKKFNEDCSDAKLVNFICCQAYVQVLFEEKGKWVQGMIGELVAYKKENSLNEAHMFLSFFSGPRQRFVINVSEIQKLTKPHPHLLVILHGKTIMGLHFPIEHKNRVDVFYHQLRPYLPSTIFANKLKQVAENVSGEMRKTANRLLNTFSVDESKGGNQWLNNPKKVITKIIRKNSVDGSNISHSRRQSDPQLFPMPKEAVENSEEVSNNIPPSSEAPKLEYASKSKPTDVKGATAVENVVIRKRVTFSSEEQTTLRRSQSLRKFYNEEVWIQHYQYTTEKPENDAFKSNVQSLINLWNSKRD